MVPVHVDVRVTRSDNIGTKFNDGSYSVCQGLMTLAFSPSKSLTFRVATERLASPEVIRNALVHVQHNVLQHQRTQRSYAVPSTVSEVARKLYRVMGLTRSVASVRHADAPVFQAIFGVEFVTAGMVAFENTVNGGRWLDLRDTDTVVVRWGKRSLAKHGKSD